MRVLHCTSIIDLLFSLNPDTHTSILKTLHLIHIMKPSIID